jgi:hypothetical protein
VSNREPVTATRAAFWYMGWWTGKKSGSLHQASLGKIPIIGLVRWERRVEWNESGKQMADICERQWKEDTQE